MLSLHGRSHKEEIYFSPLWWRTIFLVCKRLGWNDECLKRRHFRSWKSVLMFWRMNDFLQSSEISSSLFFSWTQSGVVCKRRVTANNCCANPVWTAALHPIMLEIQKCWQQQWRDYRQQQQKKGEEEEVEEDSNRVGGRDTARRDAIDSGTWSFLK